MMNASHPTRPFHHSPTRLFWSGLGGRLSRRTLLAAAGLVVPLCWSSTYAQDTGTLTGTVAGLDKAPVSQARVSVLGTTLMTLTSPDGGFTVTGVPTGGQTVEVKMIGYATTVFPVEIIGGQTLKVQSTLALAALPLKTVEVRADAAIPPEMRGFEARRLRGAGRFFSRDDISQMQPRLFTDVLRRVPGLQLEPVNGPYGTAYVVQFGRSRGVMGARLCPALFYVNGVPFPVTPDVPINHFITPEEIAGVEVYAGLSDVPAQFNSSMHNARCGVIVVWTYSGDRGRRARK